MCLQRVQNGRGVAVFKTRVKGQIDRFLFARLAARRGRADKIGAVLLEEFRGGVSSRCFAVFLEAQAPVGVGRGNRRRLGTAILTRNGTAMRTATHRAAMARALFLSTITIPAAPSAACLLPLCRPRGKGPSVSILWDTVPVYVGFRLSSFCEMWSVSANAGKASIQRYLAIDGGVETALEKYGFTRCSNYGMIKCVICVHFGKGGIRMHPGKEQRNSSMSYCVKSIYASIR